MDWAPSDLKKCLRKLRTRTAHQRRFIPALRLYELLSETAVHQALIAAKIKPHTVDEVLGHILKHGIRIFGVLVLTDQVAATLNFIEKGELQDQRLPFDTTTLGTLLPETAIDDFEESQWEVIALSFSRGTLHRSLRAEFILPFIKDEKIGGGAFGTVYEISIHPDHQDLEDVFRRKLVRKELGNTGNHRVELENLAILSHLRHPNIVELLASYTYDGRHNLIFPLAEGGTLHELFNHDPKTTFFKSDLIFFIAIAGLSSAIDQVHDFTENRLDVKLMGCHYDLRPKNILVSGENLLLADFGLSRFKDATEDSATGFKQGGGDYRAPECEDIDDCHFEKHPISRSSDIWSFGCVLAELITYMIRGPAGVKDFKASRRFRKGKGDHVLFHCGPDEPNKAVEEWLTQLVSGASRVAKMLVGLIQQMLSLDPKKRPRAKEVTGTLRLIALCELSISVNELWDDHLRRDPTSQDALIEHTRFQAWQGALGILEQQRAANMAIEISAWRLSEFQLTVENLNTIQDVLKALFSHLPGETSASLYRLWELNDRLDERLNENLQDKSRLYFKTFILQSTDEPALQGDPNSLTGLSLPAEVRMLAALKHMNERVMCHSEKDTSRRQLDIKSIKISPGYREHIIGKLVGESADRPILVEWRDYGHQSADETVQNEMFVRVDAIAEMLGQEKPKEFRGLHCRGFFHDLQRAAFGLVFDYPRSNLPDQSLKEPQSLQSLLVQTSARPKLHPALDDRFWVAYKLCQSVLEFHLVGWLHKRLTSANVLFFPTSEHLEDDWFRAPYVVGFSHSRPDEMSAFTKGPEASKTDYYQHPSYFVKGRYCAEYDYYSLGIVLLEIGLWAPLSSMIQKQQSSYEQIRQHLIEKRLPVLKKSMGRHYHEAVKSCLQGGLDGSELGDEQASDAKSLHLHFNAMVVERLAKLAEGL
ncbi:kinase-like protein [Pyrenochaeta sp. DS3sAY3a]|nr:kinase-like protein [Pyrenochaeta sp. DS3sAY3a]